MSARVKVVEPGGWAIERYHFDKPVYWNGDLKTHAIGSVDGWGAEGTAVLFHDRDSADKIISRHFNGFGRSVALKAAKP